MKVKTSELIDIALDWAVAKSLGYTPLYPNSPADNLRDAEGLLVHTTELAFSSSWSQGGPIIEREKLQVYASVTQWTSCDNFGGKQSFGPTPLIAACRCYVASKLGGEVEIPDELI